MTSPAGYDAKERRRQLAYAVQMPYSETDWG